jgi:ATP-binding cassette subfamily B protein
MKTVLRYIKPHFPIISLQFIIKLGGTIVEMLMPSMLSTILDDVVPSGSLHMVYVWGGLMALCAAVASLTNIIANVMATKISRNITEKLRYDLFAKVAYLSCKQTDKFTIPSLNSRLTADTYNVHQMLDRMQRLGIRAPIQLVGGIVIAAILDPVLTLILVAMLPILTLIIWFISKKGIPAYDNVQKALDIMVRKIQENMTGVRVIKALSKSDFEKEKFEEANKSKYEKEQRAGIIMALSSPSMNLILNVGLAIVIIVGAYRVSGGMTQPGKIVAFLSYFTMILTSLIMVSRLFVLYTKGVASARRIEDVMNAKDEILIKPGTHENTDEHIEFRSVSFSYNKKADNITDISFSLKRGETLGIIGPTGSGKSTVINLLLRFYDVDKGEIRISGDNIDSIDPNELHKKFGIVFQNDFLFADTIAENIDFGRGLSEERIKKAAEEAQASFIYEKEDGFDTLLAVKGANFSGGQKQRLLIARALAAHPEILILDDSSSALDYKTDAELRRALSREFKETTTIIVAQRVSSIMNATKIMMLEDGRVIGYGSHDELVKSCPSYREIYEIQMGRSASNAAG